MRRIAVRHLAAWAPAGGCPRHGTATHFIELPTRFRGSWPGVKRIVKLARLAGQGNAERRAPVDFAREVDRAVVELNDSKGHGQAHSRAVRFGGVVERKDSLARLGRNAHALVGNFEPLSPMV